jgi:uncharacterized protein (TIGR00288 family)
MFLKLNISFLLMTNITHIDQELPDGAVFLDYENIVRREFGGGEILDCITSITDRLVRSKIREAIVPDHTHDKIIEFGNISGFNVKRSSLPDYLMASRITEVSVSDPYVNVIVSITRDSDMLPALYKAKEYGNYVVVIAPAISESVRSLMKAADIFIPSIANGQVDESLLSGYKKDTKSRELVHGIPATSAFLLDLRSQESDVQKDFETLRKKLYNCREKCDAKLWEAFIPKKFVEKSAEKDIHEQSEKRLVMIRENGFETVSYSMGDLSTELIVRATELLCSPKYVFVKKVLIDSYDNHIRFLYHLGAERGKEVIFPSNPFTKPKQ